MKKNFKNLRFRIIEIDQKTKRIKKGSNTQTLTFEEMIYLFSKQYIGLKNNFFTRIKLFLGNYKKINKNLMEAQKEQKKKLIKTMVEAYFELQRGEK